jgi:hypothetical protein
MGGECNTHSRDENAYIWSEILKKKEACLDCIKDDGRIILKRNLKV